MSAWFPPEIHVSPVPVLQLPLCLPLLLPEPSAVLRGADPSSVSAPAAAVLSEDHVPAVLPYIARDRP